MSTLKCGPIPKHVAIIMDGNRRYARRRNLAVWKGHKSGEQALVKTLKLCLELGIETVTVFAWSIDNFKRQKEEVNKIMAMATRKCRQLIEDDHLSKNNRIRIFGDTSLLPEELQRAMAKAELLSKNNTKSNLNICFAYKSSYEIYKGCRDIGVAVNKGKLKTEDISLPLFEQFLYSHGCQEPDIIIRTSGETRLSDFMLWQGAYSCVLYYDVLWPEFGHYHMYRAIIEYQRNFEVMQERKRLYKQAAEKQQDDHDCKIIKDRLAAGDDFEASLADFRKRRDLRVSQFINDLRSKEDERKYELSKYYVEDISNKLKKTL